MTVISLAQSNIVHRKSSTYKKETLHKNRIRKILAISLIFIIAASIFSYVLQVNNIAANGYKIRELKKQVRELEEQNKVLQVNISNLKSINALQSKTQDFDMVKAESIEYVVLPITKAVAAR